MMEILGKFPKEYSTSGTNSAKYVNSQGNLHNFPEISYVSLWELLINVYNVIESEADLLSDFLL